MVRVFVGARLSLFISLASVAAMFVVGTVLGLTAGFMGRRVDGFIMRLVDVQMAFPVVLAAIALVALIGPSFWNIVLVFMVTGWPIFARTTRASTLALKESEFVEAARALGASVPRQVVRHILPNSLGPVIVAATIDVAAAITLESTLSFLGLGFPPDIPSWGRILFDSKEYLDIAPHWALFPGTAIFLAVLCISFVGDGLRDALDPRRVL
jgi:peptide/nickel transport system permease protein